MEAILHINSSNQRFSYYTRVSVLNPDFSCKIKILAIIAIIATDDLNLDFSC